MQRIVITLHRILLFFTFNFINQKPLLKLTCPQDFYHNKCLVPPTILVWSESRPNLSHLMTFVWKMERSKGRHGGEGCLDGMSGGRKSRVFKIWSKTSEQRFSQPYLQGCSSKRLIHPLNYRLSPNVIGGDSLRGVGTVSCFHCVEEEREMRVSQVEQKPSPTSHTCQKVNPQLRPHC